MPTSIVTAVKQSFTERTDLQQYGDNALLLFALQLKFQIEDIDTVASNALTDGADDKKCDLIYIDTSNGYAVVAQGYYSRDENKGEAKANKASDLNTAASWLLTRSIDDLPATLRAAATELRDALNGGLIRSLQFWYVHNLPNSTNVRNELITVENTAKAAITTNFPRSEVNEISAIEVGIEVIGEWYSTLTIPILVADEIEVTIPGGYPIAGNDWEAFVTAVPANWLHNLFQSYKSDLFSANIRGYLGSMNIEANINNNIKKTAGEDPNHFWVYNNGLTALVNNFTYDEMQKKLTLTGISIVNGAQTTGALGSLGQAPNEVAAVPARFVKCQNTETIKNIIKYNNSQNSIEAPDFRSNDHIQKKLVEEFQRIPSVNYLGGRRGGVEDVIKRPSSLLPSDTAAQALAAFHQDPIVAYNEKSRIWISDALYTKYFSERTSAKHILFAYSLLRAIEKRKRDLSLAGSNNQLTETQTRQLNFLRYRGSIFLLVAAIASCLETFLARPVPDRFMLSFGERVSPEEAQTHWESIVDATIPFADSLSSGVERGLKNRDLVSGIIRTFQNSIEATKAVNNPIFENFARVVISE